MTLSFSLLEELVEQIHQLARTSTDSDVASLALKLKKVAPQAEPALAALALDTYVARRDAQAKLGSWSAQGFFSLPVVEQASRAPIAHYRASLFSGVSHLLEVGTGVGSDTAALARVCSQITTIEVDPVRASLAEKNLAIQGISNVTVLVGDITSLASSLPLDTFDGFFADPARRTVDGRRVKDAAEYAPPLHQLLKLTSARIRAIKVSPGLFFDAPTHGWTRQFIGYGDECLEQTLWLGVTVPDSSVVCVDTGASWAPNLSLHRPTSTPPSLETGYLCEAHACINRSQFAWQFFAERGIQQLAADVAYGITSQEPARDPLMNSFAILEALPFETRTLAKTLNKLGWTNRTEIKKRNFAGDPEQIRSSLRLPAHYHQAPFGTIFLCTLDNAPWAIIARRLHE